MLKQADHINRTKRLKILASFLLFLFLGLQTIVSFHQHPYPNAQKDQKSPVKIAFSYTDCALCNYLAHQAFTMPQAPLKEKASLAAPFEKFIVLSPLQAYIAGYYLFPLPNSPPFS